MIAPSAQQLVEGNGATLFCNGTGNPWPNMSWTKQGNNTVLSSSETLILANVTGEDNRAVYKCKLQNNLGSAEANTTITVLCECWFNYCLNSCQISRAFIGQEPLSLI